MTDPSETVCEICDEPATHFCSCEMCRVDYDDHGAETGELLDGRYLCDGCGMDQDDDDDEEVET